MLDEYIMKLQKYFAMQPAMTEVEKVMYVYLDLASILRFDENFFFGSSKQKKDIYAKASCVGELNKCFENHKIICKSSAYIVEYVLKKIGINVTTISENNPSVKYNHVLNIIIPSDKTDSYKIDLQNDLANIHFHGFTANFGIDIFDDRKYIISPDKQKIIHSKLGYISSNNTYIEEYIDLFKINMSDNMSIYDRFDFVLKNIEPIPYPNVSYWERRWKHERILLSLFDQVELERKLHTIEFYQDRDGERVYNNGFFINDSNGVKIYYYSKENYQYESYDLEEFAHKVIDEDIHYKQGIMGLNHEIMMIKNSKKLIKK